MSKVFKNKLIHWKLTTREYKTIFNIFKEILSNWSIFYSRYIKHPILFEDKKTHWDIDFYCFDITKKGFKNKISKLYLDYLNVKINNPHDIKLIRKKREDFEIEYIKSFYNLIKKRFNWEKLKKFKTKNNLIYEIWFVWDNWNLENILKEWNIFVTDDEITSLMYFKIYDYLWNIKFEKFFHFDFNMFLWKSIKEYNENYYFYNEVPFFWYLIWIILKNYWIKYSHKWIYIHSDYLRKF